jgi:DNA adenine methylase
MAFTSHLIARHEQVNTQLARFPSSRYMGSKHAILPFIYDVMKDLEFTTVLDACSGSGAVSYLFKSMGKSVISNDFLRFCFHTAQACIANNSERLCYEEVAYLLSPHPTPQDFIAQTFRDLYFTETENQFLDNLVSHILEMTSPFKQSIAFAAIVRSCLRRRPRGIFTYTGTRYNDGRRDLQISLEQHFREAVVLFNASIFDNGQTNTALNHDVFQIPQDLHVDLVYIDPPYVSPHSDNDYTRRYHFVEGLSCNWQGLEILEKTKTKKFRRLPSLFDSKNTIYEAFHTLFDRFRDSIIVVSYASNGIPCKDELFAMLSEHKRKVTIYECDHRYSFGTHSHKVGNNQNEVKEFLFVGR